MKISFPYPLSSITQRFGENGSSFYKDNGLKGHPGIDFKTLFDDSILFCADGYVYKIINKDNPDLSKYRAVFQLVESKDFTYEIQYAHCNQITCSLGAVAVGSEAGTQGNTGFVAVGGKEVSTAEKNAGSKAGYHLHFQVRKCKKTLVLNPASNYLSSPASESIPYRLNGYYYEIPEYTNGYNGCIDPVSIWNGIVISEQKKEITRLQNLIESLKSQIARFLSR